MSDGTEDKSDPSTIKNSEGLTIKQIMGRCAQCHTHGTIDASKRALPPHVIDAILAYKIVPRIFCLVCKKQTEFIPTEIKKYGDVPLLKILQNQIVNGIPGLVNKDGQPLGGN